jgi:hypothetical protein
MASIYGRSIDGIEARVRAAIASTGSAKQALKLLRRHTRLIDFATGAFTIIVIVAFSAGAVGFVGMLAIVCCVGLGFLPPQTVGTIFGDLVMLAMYGITVGIGALVIGGGLFYRSGRLLHDFRESLEALRDDGTLDIQDRDYAVYLRSFNAEQHYLKHTHARAIGGSFGTDRQIHPGFFIKQSIDALQPDLMVVEALNLSETIGIDQLQQSPADFKKVCLYEFKDWDKRASQLCAQARFILLHYDDTSDGLKKEMSICANFAAKTVIFGPSSFRPIAHAPDSWRSCFPWLALIEYQSEFQQWSQPYPERIVSLPAKVMTGAGVTAIDYDGAWLRGLLNLPQQARPREVA